MAYLIDGYNLLHATGVFGVRAGPKGLERARGQLLRLLRRGHKRDDDVTVVFDAARAGRTGDAVRDFDGIRVWFAVGHGQADDLIEQLIRTSAIPKQLVVVSDDRRIQRAARARRCIVRGCLDYLDELARQRGRHSALQPKKHDKDAVPLETEHWLSAFGNLDRDPDFKEVFNPFDFDEPQA